MNLNQAASQRIGLQGLQSEDEVGFNGKAPWLPWRRPPCLIGKQIMRLQVPDCLLNPLDGGQLPRAGRIHGILDLGFDLLDEPMYGGVGAADSCGNAGKTWRGFVADWGLAPPTRCWTSHDLDSMQLLRCMNGRRDSRVLARL